MIDLKQWLADHEIGWDYAQNVIAAIRTKYPALAASVKAHPNVLGELELVLLVHDVDKRTYAPKDLPSNPERTVSSSG